MRRQRKVAPVTRLTVEDAEKELERQLEYLLRPDGDVARATQAKAARLLGQPVILESPTVHVETTLGQWLAVVTQAYAHGWRPQEAYTAPQGQTVKAEDAKQLAEVLAKGGAKDRLAAAVQVIGSRGEFRTGTIKQ